MIKLHVTKKLLAKLPIDEKGYLVNAKEASDEKAKTESPLTGWHGNLILLQRRNCILLVHDTTRFALFIPCLTKPDFVNLDAWFLDALMNTLIKCGANEMQLDAIYRHLAPLQIDTDCNRSVQGTINHIKAEIENMLWYDGLDISDVSGARTGVWLADRPTSVKGQKEYIWPREAMLALLDGMAVGDKRVSQDDDGPAVSNVIRLD
jgi:hypothetical protein